MTLPAGTRVGPYEILASIGAGGMGEVYRARDAKLGRDVAIKILPGIFASDPERLARFEREAKTLASLNHPNIAAIYGVENHALVMELVRGENLAQRIARGALPLDEALQIIRQIAAALEAAHEKGIVHRDLKPANVMLTAEGDVKVLDFGLAKAGDASGASGDLMDSPTITNPSTQLGTILGTAAYMSPEQAKGRVADRRSDVWALGCVLFEMLTARRAFEGDDLSDTLAAVLRGEPAWEALPASTPPHITAVLRQCLARDRKARIPEIAVVRYLLDGAAAIAALPGPVIPLPSTPSLVRRAWPVAASLLAGAAAVAALGWPHREAAEPPRMHFAIETIQLPPTGVHPPVALSPDGRYLAYGGAPEPSAPAMVYVRSLDTMETRPLRGTEGTTAIFWSPDSRTIGFVARGVMKKVPVAGGPPQQLTQVIGGSATGSWGSDGQIVFSSGPLTGARLHRMSDSGGVVTEIMKPDGSNHTALRGPVFLSDGRRFLYLAWSADPGKRAILAASVDGMQPVHVVQAESHPIVAPGFLLYTRGATLFAHPFDEETLRVEGDAVAVGDGVRYSQLTGRGAFTASATGLLGYFRGNTVEGDRTLAWFDRGGRPLGAAGPPATYDQIRLSPDGRRVAIALPDLRTSTMMLATLDLRSQIVTPMALPAGGGDPVWFPGSERMLFERIVDGRRDFFSMAPGEGQSTLEFASPEDPKWLNDVSRDGRYALYHQPQPGKLYSIDLSEPVEKRAGRLLFEHAGQIDGSHFSPDGRWVAYMSDETGEFEVWVAAFPAFDRRRRISLRGGGQPMWRGDGRELFYLSPDGQMMSARVTYGAGGTVDVAAPVPLFQSPLDAPALQFDQYSVTDDGQKFLIIQPGKSRDDARPEFRVVVNWTAGLR